MSSRRFAAEWLAALTVAVVVLPQSLAFGVALLAPHGVAVAAAAAAGLVGAIALNLCAGLAFGTRALVAAPAGPTTVLLVGTFGSLSAAGLPAASLPLALALLLAAAGAMQILLAALGGGRAVQFIPYPVVAGFMTGAGLSMALGQAKLVWPAVWDAAALHALLPLGVALLTALATQWLPRVFPRWPGSLLGLLTGTLAFHLFGLLAGEPAPGDWVVGALPGLASVQLHWPSPGQLTLPWRELLTAAAAFALLGAINTLLVAVVADDLTGSRHHAARTLVGLGAGQLAAGLFGGVGGTASTGPTVVAASAAGGTGRWVGVAAALLLLLMLAVGGPLGAWLPVSALAGLLLHTAWKMFSWDAVGWARHGRTRQDAGVALLVTLVTLAFDLVTAVGAGVAIALALFVKAQFEAPVVHRRSSAAERRSARARTEAERAVLEARAEAIVLYELRGSLFFAKADRLYRELAPEIARGARVVLHLRRVQQVDLTALHILLQLHRALAERGGELSFCEVHAGLGLGEDMGRALARVSPEVRPGDVRTFVGSDEALEYAEDQLLAEAGLAPAEAHRLGLADMEFCQGLDATGLAALAEVMRPCSVAPGEYVFRQGERDDSLFLVLSGMVDIRLATTAHHYLRLAAYGPGTEFGEIAFLDPGERTASAVARAPTELLALDRRGFSRLLERSPESAATVLLNLGRAASNRLRWSAEEMHRLAQW